MRSNMTEFMTIFVTVVELSSFTRASEVLQVQRPAISKIIKQLEFDLGVKLLHRTTRKLSLTDEGNEFYLRSKQILKEVDELLSFYSLTQRPIGRLRLDAPLSLAHNILIPELSKFNELYPDIDVVLSLSDKKIDILSEGVDCIIRLGELEDSSLVSHRLGEIKMMTCAAPSYIAKYGLPKTLADLDLHRAVNFFNGHSREIMDWKFVVDNERISYRLKSSILVDNSDALLSSALYGLGLIQGPAISLSPLVHNGKLIEVLTNYSCAMKTVSILFPDKLHLAPKVRVFIDWFSKIFTTYNT